MFAGHLVLAVIVGLHRQDRADRGLVRRDADQRSRGGGVEFVGIMVAFLQAYVFTFLSALFIGMAVHQH